MCLSLRTSTFFREQCTLSNLKLNIIIMWRSRIREIIVPIYSRTTLSHILIFIVTQIKIRGDKAEATVEVPCVRYSPTKGILDREVEGIGAQDYRPRNLHRQKS